MKDLLLTIKIRPILMNLVNLVSKYNPIYNGIFLVWYHFEGQFLVWHPNVNLCYNILKCPILTTGLRKVPIFSSQTIPIDPKWPGMEYLVKKYFWVSTTLKMQL